MLRAIKDYEKYKKRALRAAMRVLPTLPPSEFDKFIAELRMQHSLLQVYMPAVKEQFEKMPILLEQFSKPQKIGSHRRF